MIFKTITNETIFNEPDIIQMVLPVIIDKDGKEIKIKVPRPEYSSEIFS